ncbi:S-layer domain-containing protein [Stanieria cyanosphaera PCC 7437]|uniref:S-layer domain-containing protein n=1 Tax=Stanieria cyanosphaera (strain ATCC 29371 / PCC 7437) TaxID=111780 RepID=K9XR91_STAC7|nr:S-layer homology domain-containing protein [Stanieria cyanosphaera]AFZ34197.1 S-layer domain-containing protein [Stanieria cyanosphaera PCC 7437]
MTNSPSQPPEPPERSSSSRKRVLDSDELIAMIVAFGTIGTILFLSLTDGKNRWGLTNWQQWLAASQSTNETTQSTVDETQLNQTESAPTAQTNRNTSLQPKTSNTTESLNNNNQLLPNQAPKISRSQKPTVIVPTIITNPSKPGTPQTQPNLEQTPSTAQPPVIVPEEKESIPAIVFLDVPQNYWASPFIYQLKEQGLISGSSEDTFEPEQPITRAGMAELISQTFNQPSTFDTKQFKDVTANTEAAAEINEAVGSGFMKGYSNGEFRPQEEISRYQVLVTLATGLNLQPSQEPTAILKSFSDANQLPNWAVNQVAAAIEAGLLVNPPTYERQSLNPNQTATRAEVAAMIYQALVKSGRLPAISSEYIVPAP